MRGARTAPHSRAECRRPSTAKLHALARPSCRGEAAKRGGEGEELEREYPRLTATPAATIPPGPRVRPFRARFFRSPFAVSSPLLSNDFLLAQNVQPKA